MSGRRKRRIENDEVEVEVKVGSKSKEVLVLGVLAFAGPLPWAYPLKYGRRRASRTLLDSQQNDSGGGNRRQIQIIGLLGECTDNSSPLYAPSYQLGWANSSGQVQVKAAPVAMSGLDISIRCVGCSAIN